jgi:hypothetical protein
MSWRDLVEEAGTISPRTQAVLEDWREPDGYVSFISFMSDIARLAADMFAEETTNPVVKHELDALMGVVERRLIAGDHDERDAILTGFLELLPSANEQGHGVHERLRAQSRAAYDVDWGR